MAIFPGAWSNQSQFFEKCVFISPTSSTPLGNCVLENPDFLALLDWIHDGDFS